MEGKEPKEEENEEPSGSGRRFMTLEDVAVFLSVRPAQVYAMVRSGELPAVKLAGRGIWRVDTVRLEQFLEQAPEDTARWIREHPLSAGDQADTSGEDPDPDPGTPPP